MVAKISIFGRVFLIKSSGWSNMSGKLGSIVREGLARPKKMVVLATPPPWFNNKEALSPAQRAVNEEFANIQRQYAGMPLRERIMATKRALKGRRFAAARAPAVARPVAPARRAIQEVTE
jgi:hypothetical protein